MLDDLSWLALEVLYAERAVEFYRDAFDRSVRRRGEAFVLDVGDQELRLVEPGPIPRGGLHVHYAMATPPDRYDEWVDRLAHGHDVYEHDFGASRSLYLFDPDGHCVEIGSVGDPESAEAITGIFEVVLEVEDLDRATEFYRSLGFSVADRGDTRPRIRLTGPIDLELWEPQRGLADARGGVHVDLGFRRSEGGPLPDQVREGAQAVEPLEDGVRVRDPDGHALTLLDA